MDSFSYHACTPTALGFEPDHPYDVEVCHQFNENKCVRNDFTTLCGFFCQCVCILSVCGHFFISIHRTPYSAGWMKWRVNWSGRLYLNQLLMIPLSKVLFLQLKKVLNNQHWKFQLIPIVYLLIRYEPDPELTFDRLPERTNAPLKGRK